MCPLLISAVNNVSVIRNFDQYDQLQGNGKKSEFDIFITYPWAISLCYTRISYFKAGQFLPREYTPRSFNHSGTVSLYARKFGTSGKRN